MFNIYGPQKIKSQRTEFFLTNSILQRTNIFNACTSPPFWGDSVFLCDRNLAQCSKNTIAGSVRGEGLQQVLDKKLCQPWELYFWRTAAPPHNL